MSAQERTLDGTAWARALPRSRARRQPSAVAARVFSGPRCPLCGRPGLHQEQTGGMTVRHSVQIACWIPTGTRALFPTEGHVPTARTPHTERAA